MDWLLEIRGALEKEVTDLRPVYHRKEERIRGNRLTMGYSCGAPGRPVPRPGPRPPRSRSATG
jgi:hypothetical protein